MNELPIPIAPAKEPDWISVVEVHHDVETGHYTMVVECLVRGGELRKFELPPSLMAEPKRALSFLLDRGVIPVTDMKQPLKEIEELFRKKDIPTVNVVRRTGWLGSDFIFPDQVIGPRQGRLHYRPMDSRQRAVAKRSTYKEWREAFRPLFKSSSALTTLAAAAFVGPLLQPLGRTGFPLLHVVGGSAHARELAVRAALTVGGPSQETEVLPHSAALAQLQATIEVRRDQSVAFRDHPMHDDVGTRRKGLESTAASAVLGSFCSAKDAILGNQRISAFSFDHHSTDAGLASKSTNLVLVPLNPEDLLFDPSDDENVLPEEAALPQLDEMVSKMWGGALPAFVSKLQKDPDAIKRIKDHERKFLDKVHDKGIGASEHQARAFALIYAAAQLAAEFKVAPWDEEHARRAIIRVLRRSAKRQGAAENVADQALRKLASVMRKKDLFPRVEKGNELPDGAQQTAWGIRRKVGKVNVVAVLRDQLDHFIPDGQEQATLRAWAVAGVILLGKDVEHHTKQLQVQGMTPERPNFICFKAKVLRKLVPPKTK